jgi:hypothetical protein
LDAQLFVDRGGLKNSGLTTSHVDETASGINERRPIHFLLQIDPASIGRTAKRVQTLAGFEWRIQLSSLSPNAPLIVLRSSMRLPDIQARQPEPCGLDLPMDRR